MYHPERLPCEPQSIHDTVHGTQPHILYDELIGVWVAAEHLYRLLIEERIRDVLHLPRLGVVPVHGALSFCYWLITPYLLDGVSLGRLHAGVGRPSLPELQGWPRTGSEGTGRGVGCLVWEKALHPDLSRTSPAG
jgi:hypothetical protein